MNRKSIKNFLTKHKNLSHQLTSAYNHIPLNNFIHIGNRNSFMCYGILKKTKIRIKGNGNKIIIGELSRVINSNIEINGNDNTIIIGDRSLIVDGEFFIEDDLGTIEIGKDTNICGKTHLACIEGRNINIGNDCLFSANITFRTGDSHSIINCETKQRINQSKNISIGNHVWIGNQVTILKGVNILDHTIIGTGSLVTKSCGLEGVILAGNPAKIVKTDITWIGERI